MKFTKLSQLFKEINENLDIKEIIGSIIFMIFIFAFMYGTLWIGAILGLN